MPDKNPIGYRPTWAEISLKNLEHNFKKIRSLLKPGTKVLVTVKADAYGHGLTEVAVRLVKCGVDYLGVASIDEGIKLRKSGIKVPILVLGLVLQKDILPLFTFRLIPSVCDWEMASALDAKAKALKKVLPVHLKVDTGMGRIGLCAPEALKLAVAIHKMKNLRLEGVFTHFALADSDPEFTRRQLDLFNRLLDGLRDKNIGVPLVHAANSIGLISHAGSHFNMVRPGLVIYGLYPKPLDLDLRPVLSLKTRVVFVKKVSGGTGISYGRTYVTKKPAYIATLPVGYGDGYPRNLSNLAYLLIRGRRFRISGRICMDQIMVDAGSFKPRIGEEVVLIGRQGKEKITAEELAELSGTISYEIVCGLGSRIPRIYK